MSKFITWYLNLKFKQKLLLSFLVIIFLTTLCISGTNYAVSNLLITRYVSDYSIAISSQIASNFASQVDNIEETNFIKYQNDGAFNEILPVSDYTPIQNRLSYQSAVDNLLYSTDYYKSIAFLDLNNHLYTAGSNLLSDQSLDYFTNEAPEIKKSWGQCVWDSCPNGNLLLKRALYHLPTGTYIGCLFVEIDRDYLVKVYEQSIDRYGGSVVIFSLDRKPMISDHDTFEQIALEAVSSSAKAENHTVRMNGETYTAAVYNTPDGQWILTHIVSLSQLTGKLHVIGYWILFIGFAVFALAVVLAFLISGNISQNLKLLTDSMKQFSNGNFDEQIVPASHDEFAIIADNFNTMGQKIKTLMREVTLEQKQKQQIEYQMLEFQYNALQARLNPHFLYNILDSISSMAKLRDEYDISDWICLLSDMLRESIGQKKRLIPLDEEISYVRKYTTLYQMMYRERVTFIYKSDPSLSFIPVPAFILQPIVENAIVHGIEGISRHGVIHICSFSQDDTLILEVSDNGHGMSQDIIEMILNSRYSSEASGSPSHTKVGLVTVLDRIRLLYGPEYGIRIQSVQDEGTRIRIILPIATTLYHDHSTEDQE